MNLNLDPEEASALIPLLQADYPDYYTGTGSPGPELKLEVYLSFFVSVFTLG